MKLKEESRQTLSLCADWASVKEVAAVRAVRSDTASAVMRSLWHQGYLDRRSHDLGSNSWSYQYRVTAKGVIAAADAAALKVCAKCGVSKPPTQTYYRKNHGKGLRATCRECDNAKKRLLSKAPEPKMLDPSANAFHWKVFVQPYSLEYNPHAMANRHDGSRV
jgi:ribosomal protein L40E